MIWVGWRQQRTEALIAVGILALLAAVLVPTGLEMSSAYDQDGLSACIGQTTSQPCDEAVRAFIGRFNHLRGLVSWLTLVPGVIGILLAAPFVLQLEQGTNRLDWTQSITRGRWIIGKLGLALASALLASLAFVSLITWWRVPLTHLEGRMENSAFDSAGIVVFGYTLFALGLALAVGVVWRRAVPGLVIGFAGYFATRFFVDGWLRQRLVTPRTTTWTTDRGEPADLAHAWVLNEYPSDRFGHAVSIPCPGVHEIHPQLAITKCLGGERAVDYLHTVYHPASHFWALQGIETALFGGVALALITFSAWWTYERAG